MDSESEGDDLWYEDEASDSTEKLEKSSDMDREWQKRREQFHTVTLYSVHHA